MKHGSTNIKQYRTLDPTHSIYSTVIKVRRCFMKTSKWRETPVSSFNRG